MVCETRLRPKQSIQSRADDIRRVVAALSEGLTTGRIKAVVSPRGAIAFSGWNESDKDGVTDNCAYRRLMATGSATAKLAIQRAELLAGRTVDKAMVAAGAHSHDGGVTFHEGHK